MEGITTLVLRGISGVGKTVLRKLLVKAIEKLGKKVKVISKDEYRKFLDEREGYHYTPSEEINTSRWYRKAYKQQTKREDIDYIICDNTHLRESELAIPCTPTGRVSKVVVIELGSYSSATRSPIPDDIIQRQRKEMYEDRNALFIACMGGVSLIDLEPFEANEGTAEDIIQDCEMDLI